MVFIESIFTIFQVNAVHGRAWGRRMQLKNELSTSSCLIIIGFFVYYIWDSFENATLFIFIAIIYLSISV